MKYSLCNELFGSMDLEKTAEICKKAGYGGIEFTPFTVFGSFSPADVKTGITNIRKVLAANDLAFVGFHWLMADNKTGTSPMSLVSPDNTLREAALQRLRLLLSATGELGGGVLILGSPKHRCSVPPQSASQAVSMLRDSLSSLGDYAVNCNSTLLLEALDHKQCDVINTLSEVSDMVNEISSPGISSMFDFHNCADEKESWEELIKKYTTIIKHVHINEWDGGPPGSGSSDYTPAFKALRETNFEGWISMEIFSEPPDPAAIISDALTFMNKIEMETK